jgi:outer membrane protein assembly factor BamB
MIILGGSIAVVYAITSFGEVVAMKADIGQEIWRNNDYARFRSLPSEKDGYVYCQSVNNELITLSDDKEELAGSHSDIPESVFRLGGEEPACSGDTIIVAYTSEEIHALSKTNRQVLKSDTIIP